jgi:hypothetical protein
MLFLVIGISFIFLLFTIFRSQLGIPKRYEIGAVSFHSTADYLIIDSLQAGSPLSVQQTATLLENMIQSNPEKKKVGISFKRTGATVTLLVDLEKDILEEQYSGASGTQLQTIWKGNAFERIRWGTKNDNFEPPGFSLPGKKNLYH